MLWFIGVVVLAGVFAFAAAAAEIPEGSWGRHIASAIAVGTLATNGFSWLFHAVDVATVPTILQDLVLGALTWIVTWPWAKLIYGADARQATTIASFPAVAVTLMTMFMRWAMH